MSGKRLNKRQLREQQELQELEEVKAAKGAEQDPADGANEVEEAGDDDERAGSAAPSGGVFARLADAEDQDAGSNVESDESDDINSAAPAKSKSKNRRRRNKKKVAAVVSVGEDGKNAESITQGEAESDAIPPSLANSTPETATAKAGKKKKPKGGGGGSAGKAAAPSKGISEMSMDEFSALLASQAKINNDASGSSAPVDALSGKASTGPMLAMRGQLALSASNLDPAIELKRQFGSAAIKAYESEAGAGGNTPRASGARARAMARNSNMKVKSVLVQPKDTWPPIAMTFTGMSMELRDDARGRGKLGTWAHSRAYREVQAYFVQAVASYDPNQLVAILQRYPWHIDTLLQLSDVSRHQGDLGQASDFNARAIFAFERTALPSFASSLTSQSGPPMLDFARIENRGLWLASHRNVNFLARRGTWRTALEWAKMIIGLDPAFDHHGMLLWLDFLSIKSKQHDWLLEALRHMEGVMADAFAENGDVIINARTPFDDEDKPRTSETGTYRGALEWLPGLAYNKALALRAQEAEKGNKTLGDDNASTAALRLAISRHPQVLSLLLDKVGVPFPSGVSSKHVIFAVDISDSTADKMTDLLTHLYVARNDSLWREPEISSWLTKTLKDAWPALEKAHADEKWARAQLTSDEAICGIARHVLVSDLPDALRQKLIGLLPKSITSNSAMLDASDPVAPSGPGTTRYDDEYFGSALLERQRRQQAEMDQLPPGEWDAAQIEEFLAAAQQEGIDVGEGAAAEGAGGENWMQRLTNMIRGNRGQAQADEDEEGGDEESNDEPQ